jgi:hypothetical protein
VERARREIWALLAADLGLDPEPPTRP